MNGGIRTIAIACEDADGLEGQASAHFGRCPYYTLVDLDDGQVCAVRIRENPHAHAHRPGVMPQFIHSLGANVILAGGMGPRAVSLFQSLGIEVATGAVGRTGAVLDAWREGRLRGIVPCHHDHPESCGAHG